MVLCGDLEISSTAFWQSTPNEFNGLLRGAYQRIMRDTAAIMPLYQSKRKLKLKDLLGWELTKEDEGFSGSKKDADKASTPFEQLESLEEKIAYKKKEVDDLFDSFD